MPTRRKIPSTAPSTARTASAQADGPDAVDAVLAAGAADTPAATSATPPDASMRVVRQFRLVFNTVKTHFQQMEKQSGLSGAQVWALSVIREQPGIGVNELARVLLVRQPTASILVKSLTEQGCIEVRPHERDRRAVTLHVLPEGAKVLRRARGPHAGVLPEALSMLDPATLERLEQDMAVLISALGADERAANIPLSQLSRT